MVKPTLMILLLLLPLCLGIQQYKIKCYGEDFYMLRNQQLDCTARVPQACYTRDNGEKGCARQQLCDRPGWTCCHQDLCNATPPPA